MSARLYALWILSVILAHGGCSHYSLYPGRDRPVDSTEGRSAARVMIMPNINQLITDWGTAGIFLVVILGNIGLPVPEATVLAIAGYLVWSGRLQLLPVLIVSLVSAVPGGAPSRIARVTAAARV